MLLLTISLPLLASITAGLFGRFFGKFGCAIITITLQSIACISTLYLLYTSIKTNTTTFISLGEWIHINSFILNWNFYGNNLTLMLSCIVTIVSTLVHIYSYEYMKADPHQPKFFSYLSLFTFFMLILLTGDNFIILFVGWEGVGICSYLLINFWTARIQANKSAIKAIIINRIGDFGLTMGIVLCFKVFNSLEFAVIFPLISYYTQLKISFIIFDVYVLDLICSLLFLGAVGKSAQIGLHMWLPDAMEGPTPVSALIHAATMVTAGVFLIIKCSPIFEYVPNVLIVMTILGSLTAIISATIGLVQNDLKKVIAFSTCSQLGYMILACGISNYGASFFHLINHAFFKALLFLSAGALIHSLSNEQDMRKFGGLLNILPYTSIMFVIGSLALTGFPFLTGFYSKDFIIESALAVNTIVSNMAYILAVFTAYLTAYYSYRVFYLVFLSKNRSFRKVITNIHELPVGLAFPLAILALGSIFFGYIFRDLFIGLGSDFFNNNIWVLPNNNNYLNAEFYGLSHVLLSSFYDPVIVQLLLQYNPTTFNAIEKVWTIYYTLVALLWIYSFYSLKLFSFSLLIRYNFLRIFWSIYLYLFDKWFFDRFLKEVVLYLYKFSENVYKLVDKGWIEQLGPKFTSFVLYKSSRYQTIKVVPLLNQSLEYALICMFILLIYIFWLF